MGLFEKTSVTVKSDAEEAMASLAHNTNKQEVSILFLSNLRSKLPESVSCPRASTYLESTVDVLTTVRSSVNKVLHNLKVVFELFTFFGLNWDHDINRSFILTFNHWLFLDLHQELENFIKYISAYQFAHLTNQEIYGLLPNKPEWIINPNKLCCGNLNNFMIRCLHQYGLKFAWSLLQMKRGCAPLDWPNVVKSINSHRTVMSDLEEGSEYTLWYIRKCTGEFFSTRDKKVLRNLEFSVPTPSLNAGFDRNSSKPNGGNRNYIRDTLNHIVEEYCQEHGYSMPMNGLKPNMDGAFITLKRGVQVTIDPDTWEETEIETDSDEIRYKKIDDANFLIPHPVTDTSMISDTSKFELLQKHILTQINTQTNAGVVALREPFKVRIITKSDSLVNYYGIPLQKALHKILREKRVTRLIGEPLSLEIIENTYNCVPQGHIFVSGDYSQATDKVYSNCSVAILDEIINYLDVSKDVRCILLKTLQGQLLHYKTTLSQFKDDVWKPASLIEIDIKYIDHIKQINNLYKKKKINLDTLNERTAHEESVLFASYKECGLDISPLLQTRGQLMGSILSFPILCLLNIFMFKRAYDEWVVGKPDSFKRNPSFQYLNEKYGLLVNGDDISFHAPPELVAIWDGMYGKVGLTQSVGKNYKHPSIITINSRLYICTRGKENMLKWREIKMLNLGLLFAGSSYVQDLDDRRRYDLIKSYSAIQRDLLDIDDAKVEYNEVTFNNALLDTCWENFCCDDGNEVLWTEERQVVHELFMYNNSMTLSELSGPMNWFMPSWAGGMGLISPNYEQINAAQSRYLVYMLTRSTPDQIFDAKFKYLSTLPSMTQVHLNSLKNICSLLKPELVWSRNVEDDVAELDSFLLSLDPYENTISEDVLEKIKNFDTVAFHKERARLHKCFRTYSKKVFFGSSLKSPSKNTIKSVQTGEHPEPIVLFSEEFTLTTHRGMARYHTQ